MSRWGDTSSDEDHHRHNDDDNQEATAENVEAVSSSCVSVSLLGPSRLIDILTTIAVLNRWTNSTWRTDDGTNQTGRARRSAREGIQA